jgi:FkbH-like protein
MAPGMTDLRPEDGYQHWRRLASSPAGQPATRADADIALLATFTTDLVSELLPLAGRVHGLGLRVREVPFGQVERSLMDPASPVYRQPPRYVVLAGTHADFLPASFVPGDADAAERLVSEAVDRLTGLWASATGLGSQVIQLGYAPPATDPLGPGCWRSTGSVSAIVREVNWRLAARAGTGVRFVDVERLAAVVGLPRWSDPRCWYRFRQPFSMDAVPWLAAAVAETIAVDTGATRRCIVVDLDNTLWGGVIGQDGIRGLVLGSGPDGEAYADFQRFLRGLVARGLVLAVCSKNDPGLAERAIGEVPGMVLRPEDFAAISSGWEPKSRQLVALARQLRLGLDALVFADDDAAECAEVAAALPDVAVVHLAGRPSAFPTAVASVRGLASGSSDADAARARSYAALRQAEELRAQHPGGLDEHLRGLEMTATLTTVDGTTLARVAELVAKTNQFNLTTRRRTEAQLAGLLADGATFAACLRLADRFADHGIVGVVLASVDGEDAEIDTLLLSCRVIGRTAERNLVAAAAQWASARGAGRLLGRYLPTRRNAVVRDFYAELGFRLRDETPAGARTFEYDLTLGCPPRSPFITLREAIHAD